MEIGVVVSDVHAENWYVQLESFRVLNQQQIEKRF